MGWNRGITIAVMVMLSVVTNLDGDWSAFMISSFGMFYWRAFGVISGKNCDLASTQKDFVIIVHSTM